MVANGLRNLQSEVVADDDKTGSGSRWYPVEQGRVPRFPVTGLHTGQKERM